MSKLHKSYNNQDLLDALKDRDSVLESIKGEINGYDYSDEELEVLDKFENLTPFQKDLVYLSSQISVYDVADLYDVSASLLYKHLREIKQILHK